MFKNVNIAMTLLQPNSKPIIMNEDKYAYFVKTDGDGNKLTDNNVIVSINVKDNYKVAFTTKSRVYYYKLDDTYQKYTFNPISNILYSLVDSNIIGFRFDTRPKFNNFFENIENITNKTFDIENATKKTKKQIYTELLNNWIIEIKNTNIPKLKLFDIENDN